MATNIFLSEIFDMKIRLITKGREAICRDLLSQLPEWFGIQSALDAYAQHASRSVMFVAEVEGCVVGFVSLAEHFERNCEIHSMGVLPDQHRQGIGRALVEAVAQWAQENGFEFLSVKTLSGAHADLNYAQTRHFYKSVGFQPFEELKELWSADLPCLLLVRRLVN